MNKNIDIITINDLWKEDSDGAMPILLEVYNPDIIWDSDEYQQDNCYLRLIADENKVKYKGHTWLPSVFEFTPPDTDGTKIGSASITISAIDARVKYLLRIIDKPCKVKIEATFAKMEKTTGGFTYKFVPIRCNEFVMTSASSTDTSATFNLTYKTSLEQSVPYDVATQDRFPAVSD